MILDFNKILIRCAVNKRHTAEFIHECQKLITFVRKMKFLLMHWRPISTDSLHLLSPPADHIELTFDILVIWLAKSIKFKNNAVINNCGRDGIEWKFLDSPNPDSRSQISLQVPQYSICIFSLSISVHSAHFQIQTPQNRLFRISQTE